MIADYYLQNPPQQPKREIAEYVESQGILVPRRFANLQEARASGLPLIARSEHPQDYAGASGIVESRVITNAVYNRHLRTISSEAELKESILGELEEEHMSSAHMQYCRLLGLDVEKFKEEVSF